MNPAPPPAIGALAHSLPLAFCLLMLGTLLPRGVRPRLEGKPRTPLSSRVATRPCAGPPGRTGGPSLCSEGGEDGSGVAGAAEAPST